MRGTLDNIPPLDQVVLLPQGGTPACDFDHVKDLFVASDYNLIVVYLSTRLGTTPPLCPSVAADAWSALGAALQLRREWEAACHALRQAIKCYGPPGERLNRTTPSVAVTYARLAHCMMKVKQPEWAGLILYANAAEEMFCYLKMRGSRLAFWNRYVWAGALHGAGRPQEALRIGEHTLGEPGCEATDFDRAVLLCDMGVVLWDSCASPNAGWQHWVRAFHYWNTDPFLLGRIGMALAMLSQFRWAERLLSAALEVTCENDTALRDKLSATLEDVCARRVPAAKLYPCHFMCNYCERIADDNNVLPCPCGDAYYCDNDHCQLTDWERTGGHAERCTYKQ